MGDVLEVKDVTVRRNKNQILDGVTWDVNEGERWVILGPNGAGKTTLVQLVSARMHPTSGSVSIIGEELGRIDLNELRPLVGMSSSAMDNRILPSERVIDVVQTAAYGTTARWREEYDESDTARAQSLLDVLGVGELADRRFGTVSSGEKKRIGVARALMPNPEILILDEPTSGLDLGGREQLLATLTELAESSGAPVLILVTHHVEEIPVGFTHALLMKDGKSFAAGPIGETLTAQNLSDVFEMPIELEEREGRYSARAVL